MMDMIMEKLQELHMRLAKIEAMLQPPPPPPAEYGRIPLDVALKDGDR